MFLTLYVSPYRSPHKRIWDPLGARSNARGRIVQLSHAALTLLDQLNHAVERVNGIGCQLRAGVRNALPTIDASTFRQSGLSHMIWWALRG